MMMIIALTLALIATLGDMLTTAAFKKLDGKESNGIMNNLERKIGLWPGMIVLKSGMLLFVGGLIWLGKTERPHWETGWLLWTPIIALQTYAIIKNLQYIRKLKAQG